MTSTPARLASVLARSDAAAVSAQRSPDEVTLVAVSKGHGLESILEAYGGGQRDFGESRGQALAEKAHQLPDDIRWHFIGPLQTNKVRIVRPHATLLHSFDRQSLVGPWLKGLGDPPPALMQINIGREPQKSGVEPDEAASMFGVWEAAGIRLEGVMAIPPISTNHGDARVYFAEMRAIRDELAAVAGRPLELSMGMTEDFEIAIAEGSTMIRVGTAIFGPRTPVGST